MQAVQCGIRHTKKQYTSTSDCLYSWEGHLISNNIKFGNKIKRMKSIIYNLWYPTNSRRCFWSLFYLSISKLNVKYHTWAFNSWHWNTLSLLYHCYSNISLWIRIYGNIIEIIQLWYFLVVSDNINKWLTWLNYIWGFR